MPFIDQSNCLHLYFQIYRQNAYRNLYLDIDDIISAVLFEAAYRIHQSELNEDILSDDYFTTFVN